ncbi:MAG: class I SAM-dependent methyltransferase [Solirubrobacterales bacterium]|nr:class I SAM-dependent methyltransferase [Solirubrobacterales bacterium]HRV60710.1 class I SAM-dependent methyltransferase [Solirubrobacterales bacterium]
MSDRITGERASEKTGGFNPAWQRHSFAYAVAGERLGEGKVLDLGCGTGHSFDRLAPRESVGVDISPDALVGQDRETLVADIREVPLPDDSFPSVLSSHSIEHVPDPEKVVAEAARLLEEDGQAVFITPNRLTFGRPDEIIDPFHYIEFSPDEFEELCRKGFSEVEVEGVYGSPRYMELFNEERKTLDRLLRLDPLRLRRLVPMRLKQWLYDFLLNHFRKDDDPRAELIDQSDFEIRAGKVDDCLDVFAFCRGPLKETA